MSDNVEYIVQLPLIGHQDDWFDVVRALTPDGAAEVVRILLQYRTPDASTIRIVTRPAERITNVY